MADSLHLNGQWGIADDDGNETKVPYERQHAEPETRRSKFVRRAKSTLSDAKNYVAGMVGDSSASSDEDGNDDRGVTQLREAPSKIIVRKSVAGAVYSRRQTADGMRHRRPNMEEMVGDDIDNVERGHYTQKSLRDRSFVRIERSAERWSDARVHMEVSIGSFCQVCALLAVALVAALAVFYVLVSNTGWYTWNTDTLATTYSNLMLLPDNNGGKTFSNSEQKQKNYVRYENYTEFITSSVDFLFATDVFVDGLIGHSSSSSSPSSHLPESTSLAAAELGESNYVATYHRHLSSEPNVPGDHVTLASINTMSKMDTDVQRNANRSLSVYGKLSMATFDPDDDAMFEVATYDRSNIHMRAPNVFVRNDLFVGDHVYFGVHRKSVHGSRRNESASSSTSEVSIYLPLLSVSDSRSNAASFEVATGGDPDYDTDGAQHANHYHTNVVLADKTTSTSVEYAMNVGSADIDHVNVLASHSVVVGTFERASGDGGDANGHYHLSMVHTPNATHCAQPLLLDAPSDKLYTDATYASSVQQQHADASSVEKIKRVPVHRFRSSRSNREHFSFLAQELASVLPDAVHHNEHASLASVLLGNEAEHRAKPSDHGVQVGGGAQHTHSVDTDALLAHLVLAVQQQQQQIEALQAQLSTAPEQK